MIKASLKHIIYLDAISLYGYATPTYLPTIWFKWIDPNDFDSNKYSSISSKRSALEVDLGHPKELCGLHNK